MKPFIVSADIVYYAKIAILCIFNILNHISKNKIQLTPEIDVDKILSVMKEKYAHKPVNDVDGVKIEFDSEWVHLRKSNTEPIIRIYSESKSLESANTLANKIIEEIKEVI